MTLQGRDLSLKESGEDKARKNSLVEEGTPSIKLGSE